MSETGGMLDTYLICQALGWEWNFTSIVILTFAPLLIIGGALLFFFVVLPWLIDLFEKWGVLK